MTDKRLLDDFNSAKEIYAKIGVDVEAAIKRADALPISMHCWQGDDVIGFDGSGELDGGIATTGNYPGRARNADELRSDIDKAMSLIPGQIKLNLHASYAELNGKNIDRDEYTIDQFSAWADWANQNKIGLDFNATIFSHKMMDGNYSLASPKEDVRRFWIEHGKRCREIGEEFAKRLGKTCVVNYWMPDGSKDIQVNTSQPRERMIRSLDEIFERKIDTSLVVDAIESKLFGMGIESYTVANHEFSLGYCISRNKCYTLDAGHFHPTEYISAKISSVLQYLDSVLLHVSRGVRWDSDHVVLWDEELQAIASEIIRNNYDDRVYVGLDFFDASINRIACWAIGTRNTRKALLKAALDPIDELKRVEADCDYTSRLALLEEAKSMPFSSVWNYYCAQSSVPVGREWLADVKEYERDTLSKR